MPKRRMNDPQITKILTLLIRPSKRCGGLIQGVGAAQSASLWPKRAVLL
jgi:hypothetical protein